jgi:hypothetical protein
MVLPCQRSTSTVLLLLPSVRLEHTRYMTSPACRREAEFPMPPLAVGISPEQGGHQTNNSVQADFQTDSDATINADERLLVRHSLQGKQTRYFDLPQSTHHPSPLHHHSRNVSAPQIASSENQKPSHCSRWISPTGSTQHVTAHAGV